MSLQDYIEVALVSYLLGSIPFGYILVHAFLKKDIRATGSGNIGATNVARSGAKGLAAATLMLDIAKGTAAVWLARKFFSGSQVEVYRLAAFAGLFVVLGHCFTAWLKFKGGKGVATALGAFLVLTPKGAVVALAVFILVFAVTRYVSLGSLFAAVAVPASTSLFGGVDLVSLALLALTCMVVIVKHHQNIGRLINGTESRFGVKK